MRQVRSLMVGATLPQLVTDTEMDVITKNVQMQRLIRQYKDKTGKTEVGMREVAEYAHANGWPLPKPADPMDLLAKAFSEAAREEYRHDAKTGRPYRVNHAVSQSAPNGAQFTFWVDIDETNRKYMEKSAVQRREQVVGDVVQLSFDLDHWNSMHPDEEPIRLQTDFSDDVEWRKNAPDDKAA